MTRGGPRRHRARHPGADRRDKSAAKRLLRKLLKCQCRTPRVMVTDKLGSYSAAKRELIPGVEHRRHKGLNNRRRTCTSRRDDENDR
jgi:transposase-like protein